MRHNPQPLELYRHFKGNLYQIRCLARHSETGETLVIYQAMYGDFAIYARPLSMFMDEVDRHKYPDVAQKYRFELQSNIFKEDEDVSQKPQAIESSETASGSAGMGSHKQMQADEQTQTDNGLQESDTEELHIDPLLLQFLDADSYERKLDILDKLHNRIDDKMINTMAVAVDLEVKDGDLEDRYWELRNCLLTFEKFECNRLR